MGMLGIAAGIDNLTPRKRLGAWHRGSPRETQRSDIESRSTTVSSMVGGSSICELAHRSHNVPVPEGSLGPLSLCTGRKVDRGRVSKPGVE